jgi:Mg-chelatase subunit ChlD
MDDEDSGESALGGKTDLMRQLYFRSVQGTTRDDDEDRRLVRLILEHAKQIIAHPAKPEERRLEEWTRAPFAELALEETLEEDPMLTDEKSLLVEQRREKRFSCATILDCSSSMSGDKHLLASIAVAVLLLEVPSAHNALTVFASDAKTVKDLDAQESPEATVLRFLKTRPKGFTNIHAGLAAGLSQYRRAGVARRKVGLLASDGRSTEGPEATDIARQYDFLVVLHLHGPGSLLEASEAIAQAGNGVCLEVKAFEELPRRLYDALRLIARR